MCVVDRCRDAPLSTTVVLVPNGTTHRETVMTQYSNPALDAELAYRRQRLENAGRGGRRWFPLRRRDPR
jgi:hypothetical protein